MLMETASVQIVGLHPRPASGIPRCCAAPARHLRARTSATGLKPGSFGIASCFEKVLCSQSHFETLHEVLHEQDEPILL